MWESFSGDVLWFQDTSCLNLSRYRGNSLITKAVDNYQKLVGLNYLHRTLGPALRKIVEMKKVSFEVDPTKASKGDNLEKNAAHLRTAVESVVQRVFQSYNDCPRWMLLRPMNDMNLIDEARGMCLMLRNIRNQVEERFHDSPAEELETVRYTALSGFLFLRFFVPAILNPKLFELQASKSPVTGYLVAQHADTSFRTSTPANSTKFDISVQGWFRGSVRWRTRDGSK